MVVIKTTVHLLDRFLQNLLMIGKKTEKPIKETNPPHHQDPHHLAIKIVDLEVIHQDHLLLKRIRSSRNRENRNKREIMKNLNKERSNSMLKKENQVDQKIEKIRRIKENTHHLLLLHHVPNRDPSKNQKNLDKKITIRMKKVFIKKATKIKIQKNINVKATINLTGMIGQITKEMKGLTIMTNLQEIMSITRKKETKRAKKQQEKDQTALNLQDPGQIVQLERIDGTIRKCKNEEKIELIF